MPNQYRFEGAEFTHLTDVTGILDEAALRQPCHFTIQTLRGSKDLKFKAKTSYIYSDWITCLVKSLKDGADARMHGLARVSMSIDRERERRLVSATSPSNSSLTKTAPSPWGERTIEGVVRDEATLRWVAAQAQSQSQSNSSRPLSPTLSNISLASLGSPVMSFKSSTPTPIPISPSPAPSDSSIPSQVTLEMLSRDTPPGRPSLSLSVGTMTSDNDESDERRSLDSYQWQPQSDMASLSSKRTASYDNRLPQPLSLSRQSVNTTTTSSIKPPTSATPTTDDDYPIFRLPTASSTTSTHLDLKRVSDLSSFTFSAGSSGRGSSSGPGSIMTADHPITILTSHSVSPNLNTVSEEYDSRRESLDSAVSGTESEVSVATIKPVVSGEREIVGGGDGSGEGTLGRNAGREQNVVKESESDVKKSDENVQSSRLQQDEVLTEVDVNKETKETMNTGAFSAIPLSQTETSSISNTSSTTLLTFNEKSVVDEHVTPTTPNSAINKANITQSSPSSIPVTKQLSQSSTHSTSTSKKPRPVSTTSSTLSSSPATLAEWPPYGESKSSSTPPGIGKSPSVFASMFRMFSPTQSQTQSPVSATSTSTLSSPSQTSKEVVSSPSTDVIAPAVEPSTTPPKTPPTSSHSTVDSTSVTTPIIKVSSAADTIDDTNDTLSDLPPIQTPRSNSNRQSVSSTTSSAGSSSAKKRYSVDGGSPRPPSIGSSRSRTSPSPVLGYSAGAAVEEKYFVGGGRASARESWDLQMSK
ncbi:hypothetical protein HDU76_008827, partial [Blyttiomyces sp. JEL0837]